MKYRVSQYRTGSMTGYLAWYYDTLAEARAKRSDLLASTPDNYTIELESIADNE